MSRDKIMAANAKVKKMRLDLLLVERGLVTSRGKARALIMSGKVHGPHRRLDKPGQELAVNAQITIKGAEQPWVSRGGIKLAHGLESFAINPKGLTCLDIGASTGGFTDVLLKAGAVRVYAVDVGRGQLAWSLRNNEQVVVLERTNARYLSRAQIPEAIDLIVCDASFISLRTVLPAALSLAASGASLVALIKPQFEVGPAHVGKGGVVREPDLHYMVCADIAEWLNEQEDWTALGTEMSPIKGIRGNTEFFIAGRRSGQVIGDF